MLGRSAELSACHGKLAYPSKGAALEGLRRIQARRPAGRTMGHKYRGLHPYRCERCKEWHLGNER